MQSPEARHVFSSAPPAGREVLTLGCNQTELLMKENERLRQELEGHVEKAARIQKVKVFSTLVRHLHQNDNAQLTEQVEQFLSLYPVKEGMRDKSGQENLFCCPKEPFNIRFYEEVHEMRCEPPRNVEAPYQ